MDAFLIGRSATNQKSPKFAKSLPKKAKIWFHQQRYLWLHEFFENNSTLGLKFRIAGSTNQFGVLTKKNFKLSTFGYITVGQKWKNSVGIFFGWAFALLLPDLCALLKKIMIMHYHYASKWVMNNAISLIMQEKVMHYH